MTDVDQTLSNAIATREPRVLEPVRDRFPEKFVSDLETLFEKQNDDPNRWFALAIGLSEASLHTASASAFTEALALLPLASERAKVYFEWAQHDEAAGRTQNAGMRYATAFRLDRGKAEAEEKFKTLVPAPPRIMLGTWDVFGMLNNEDEFQRVAPLPAFPTLADDVCRNGLARRWFHAAYTAEIATGCITDCSFVVMKEARPVLRVDCDIRGDRSMACREVPIVFSPAADADEDDLPAAYELGFQYLAEALRYVGSPTLHLEEPSVPVLTPAAIFAAERSGTCRGVKRAFIDLGLEEAEIWKGVRKGHRHAVNWGRKKLELRHWDGRDDQLFADLLGLYDRSDRTQSFKDADDIRPFWSGDAGELTLAYLDGAPVGAVGVCYEGTSAYYTSSVSVDHGDIAPSHWPLYNAILRARERGIRNFSFGYLEIDPNFGEKKRAIAHFKNGFTRQSEDFNWWIANRSPSVSRSPASDAAPGETE